MPRSLKSWITRRTCDSSVIHIAAIYGTEFPTPDANKIAARSRVAKCLAFLARLFNAVASASASDRTNTSGGRILTSTNRMHPNSPPAASFRSNLQRRATSRVRGDEGGASTRPPVGRRVKVALGRQADAAGLLR